MFTKGLPSADLVTGHVRERPHSWGAWLFFSSSDPCSGDNPGRTDPGPARLLPCSLALRALQTKSQRDVCSATFWLFPVHRRESEALGVKDPV